MRSPRKLRGMVEDRLNLPFTGLVSFMRVPTCTDLDAVDADIAILGAPTDEGSPWKPGARFAPRKTFDNITRDVRRILDAGAFPVVIGGDHAVTYPVVRAYTERLNVVHFDAHMDYRPFVHGVQWANGNPIRNVARLKTCHHIVQVGIRSLRTRQADVEDSRARGNDVVTIPEFRRRGPRAIVDLLPSAEPVYCSIDVDVLDLPLVPGCASSEVNGLTYDELRQTLFAIARGREVIGFDFVEVNPMLDVAADNTSQLAAQLIIEFLGRIVEHPGYRKRHPMRATKPAGARRLPGAAPDGRGPRAAETRLRPRLRTRRAR